MVFSAVLLSSIRIYKNETKCNVNTEHFREQHSLEQMLELNISFPVKTMPSLCVTLCEKVCNCVNKKISQ